MRRWGTIGCVVAILATACGVGPNRNSASAHDQSQRSSAVGTTVTYAVQAGIIGAITWGDDGNLWANDSGRILRVTKSGSVAAYNVSGLPRGITSGPDGNIWFTEDGGLQSVAS